MKGGASIKEGGDISLRKVICDAPRSCKDAHLVFIFFLSLYNSQKRSIQWMAAEHHGFGFCDTNVREDFYQRSCTDISARSITL